MYGKPGSYSDWARHFERRRERENKWKRRGGIALALLMAGAGVTLLGFVACAPVPV